MPRVSAPLVLLPAWLVMVACSPHSLRIAAILDDPMECSRGERLSITLAKNRINRAPERLGKAKVEVDIFELLRDSEYETAETMCQILPKGVVAVLGPSSSPASSSIISNICGEKEVPHFKVAPEEFVKFQFQRFTTLNLHPSNTDISVAVAGILNFFNCTTACLICAKAECLLNLEKLLRQFLISKDTLSVRMLDDTRDPTPLLKEIRDDKTATIIIHANASMSHTILLKAAELGMASAYYTYIFTNLEFSLQRMDSLVDDRVNILGFSIFNQSHAFFQEFAQSLNQSWQENCDHVPFTGPALSSALLFDAVYAVLTAVQELNRSQEIGVKPLSCGSAQIWQHGTSLMNYLRMVELEGLTGHIEFNSKGQRSNYALKILQFTRNGFRQIGQWHVAEGLSMDSHLYASNISDTLFNTTLVVTTILENPYLMLKGNHQEMEGNDRYEGFCVDMLKELAEILRFNYKIRLVGDGVYGVPEANGTWTGMVGELIARKADLAVAGLTITAEREKVIDFSKPFMTLGISILYRVHMGRKPGYFSFLDPFSPGVWLFMLLAYLAVSCVLFLVARLTPYEWYSPHPCAQGRCNLLVNQYSLGNSLWFPVGGFMQQGSTIAPRALSTRCVSGVWWAFTLIIISSYTANLAAFLTVQRMDVPIESVDDLADQTAIEYGTIHGGSSMTFFQNSRYQTYQRMWNYMYSKQPSVFVKSTEEGIARVLNSNYAFLLESTMNEYYRQRNCNLTQIGGLLDTKGYGIGMPVGSVFRDEFDLAILQLQENNRLEILKRKWWEGGKCPKEEDHRAKGLGMENIGGIFVVLICGLIVAIFMAMLEFLWTLRHSEATEVSVCQEMVTELRSIILCQDSIHPRRRRAGVPPPRPPIPEERRPRGTATLSNGKLCGAGEPDQLAQRLAQEAALVARGCTHIRVCPECRRFQGLRARPSPARSEESLEWEKTTNSSEPE
ncbi:glutamate receptor ionotropic, kainate 4 isoform X1 [Pongo abelii]|uniref:Glutamate receptor n=1 Tax=Pongo abelii TaxID=9601 RepID=A0A2J8X0I3_PONAB|nr:glutamate receptor ionotropic, kainate 4 isoform X1 [Pongo abelii]XP_024111675.1 glutamate receptor ionotropic, kainate 4 isoform X1 [Pongo abelii]XP_024111676.1 glutamate receptor ionotropic, kainate 4 isoform X1 [Pongo abelii]XP_054381234.1 glutamate receptor ionotropic, kainate 4 isoform X1 [Pongo abelii]XP_054381235.1 glutamate receptor ionotropic, kainate 4 isoform X1 [Pongo abelii]XP_054381236.1 glutamate receptor ionotropic, kainate 4 isoform X1 [Pongo abelii]XP_054381237.1 glutamat